MCNISILIIGFVSLPNSYIVTEFCIGSLVDFVMGTYEGPEIGDIKSILKQVCQAVEHLHLLNMSISSSLCRHNKSRTLHVPLPQIVSREKRCKFGHDYALWT